MLAPEIGLATPLRTAFCTRHRDPPLKAGLNARSEAKVWTRGKTSKNADRPHHWTAHRSCLPATRDLPVVTLGISGARGLFCGGFGTSAEVVGGWLSPTHVKARGPGGALSDATTRARDLENRESFVVRSSKASFKNDRPALHKNAHDGRLNSTKSLLPPPRGGYLPYSPSPPSETRRSLSHPVLDTSLQHNGSRIGDPQPSPPRLPQAWPARAPRNLASACLGQRARHEGRLPPCRRRATQEAQLWRAQDCACEAEQRNADHGLHPRRGPQHPSSTASCWSGGVGARTVQV
ncbi:hypothetical protein L7F22_012593 [Adiantum nelumboides]|nr:hypothetical protein [Adiantum nelumboides]